MKLLLDTHIWLWSLLQPAKLSRRVATALTKSGNELWLSPISVWELSILVDKRRIVLRKDVADWVAEASERVPTKEATLTTEVALETRKLKLAHNDPADRFLAATASIYGLTLVTADARLLSAKGYSTMSNR